MQDEDRIYQDIRAAADHAAGPAKSMRYRARGYLDLYHQSGGTCRFALVAAHGALWASWYLVVAKCAAAGFSLVDVTDRRSPRRKFADFAAYVDVLKDINKLVMVETYVLVHTIQRLGVDYALTLNVPADVVRDYAAAMAGEAVDLRDLYHRHFLWEQERVVSSKLDIAFAAFEWRFMRNLCQQPWVWFSYFRVGKSMNFRSFTDEAERVEKGLIAYDRAESYGAERLARFTARRLTRFPGLHVWRHSLRRRITGKAVSAGS